MTLCFHISSSIGLTQLLTSEERPLSHVIGVPPLVSENEKHFRLWRSNTVIFALIFTE